MNAPAGIEPDNDHVVPVRWQCKLNAFNNALPSPAPLNQADWFAEVQVGGLDFRWNRFVLNRHFVR